MKEIEVKIIDIDPKKVVAKLKRLKAKKLEQGFVAVRKFDFPDKRITRAGCYLRVRDIAGRVEVAFKGKIKPGRVKNRLEIQFTSDNFKNVCEMMEQLGLRVVSSYEKYRATYMLGGVKLEFDRHPRIPWFIEVEAGSAREVRKIVKLLGFDMSDREKILGRGFNKRYGKAWEWTKFRKLPNYAHLFR